MKYIISILLVLLISCSKKNTTNVDIGTGSISGVYYPVGGAIAEMVNKNTSNIKMTVQTSGGSVSNANAIFAKELDFGIIQSDRQYQAYMGLAEWQGKANKSLRSVFALHHEAVTLVGKDTIKSVSDLRNYRVNIGNVGSGQRQNALDILKEYDVSLDQIKKVESQKAGAAVQLMQDDRIDALFYTVGHPNGTMSNIFAINKGVRILDISVSDEFLKKYPYYDRTTIYSNNYPKYLKQNVQTFGVKAILCTKDDVPEDVVYKLTKTIFENFDKFKTYHNALRNLTKKDLISVGNVPIHPGAMKYYKEAGLL